MNQKHSTFILQMIKHGDKLRAYQAAYPKAKGQSAIKAAERLLRQPEIATEIQTVMQDIRSKTVIETYKVMQQEHQVRILSVMKKREILNQIATCEMKVGRWIKDEDGYRMVYEDPRPRDIIHAIDKDTKLEEACNRMRDITDIKFSRFDIYIDGRPCDDPTAPINPDIPMGLIMIPKKKHASSFPVLRELRSNHGDNQKNITSDVTSGFRREEEDGRVDEVHAEDGEILNHNSGNKKEQNAPLSPSGGSGEVRAEGGILAEIHTSQNVLPLGELEGLDYLTHKKQYIAEKQKRTENDPMSESFYKNFTHDRNAAPPPHIYTDEEIEAINNAEEKEVTEVNKKDLARQQPNEESSLQQIKDFARQQPNL